MLQIHMIMAISLSHAQKNTVLHRINQTYVLIVSPLWQLAENYYPFSFPSEIPSASGICPSRCPYFSVVLSFLRRYCVSICWLQIEWKDVNVIRVYQMLWFEVMCEVFCLRTKKLSKQSTWHPCIHQTVYVYVDGIGHIQSMGRNVQMVCAQS